MEQCKKGDVTMPSGKQCKWSKWESLPQMWEHQQQILLQ